MKNRKVVILHSIVGEEDDEDSKDTLIQVEAVSKAFEKLGFSVKSIEFEPTLQITMGLLKKEKPGLVFNLVESVNGSGKLIYLAPCVLEYLGFPYTGCPPQALYLTSSKLLTKVMLRKWGIPTPEWFSYENFEDCRFYEGKYIIKPVWEHASRGIDQDSTNYFPCKKKLLEAMKKKEKEYGWEVFAERYIEGREISVSLLSSWNSPQVLPPAWMKFYGYSKESYRVLDYRAKWDHNSPQYRETRRSFSFDPDDKELLKNIENIALTLWNRMGLNGYARVDFRVEDKKSPMVIDINTNPCISPDSGFVAAAKKAKITYEQMIERIANSRVVPGAGDRFGYKSMDVFLSS